MINQDLYKATLGSFPSGVTVVMAYDSDGRVTGLTASAFSALSMDPPLILVCPQYRSESYQVLSEATHFSVNILAADQGAEAWAFAKKGADKVAALAQLDIQQGVTGVPVLASTVAVMECCHWRQYEGGDHAILVGEVQHMANDSGRSPMVYCRGDMGSWPMPVIEEAC
jgi:flavin reductase (DIM6/NTAB) family NADH-FMN oxidoreductase RutF